jgi:predicted nucleic acid-binding protein
MNYLVDSDIIIDYLRDFKPTIENLDILISGKNSILVSAVTNLELHTGRSITNPKMLAKINTLFSLLKPTDIDFEIAGLAGDLRREYEIGVSDALIAACAILNNCILLTRNIKHYKKVKELKVKSL